MYRIKFIFKILLFIFNVIFFSTLAFSTELDFEVVVHNEGASTKNLIFHTMNNQFLAILDSNLVPYWQIKVDEIGLDFKVNQNNLTYFQKDSTSWIVLNSEMQEVDTLKCTNELKADYHDIQLLESGGYILQSYHDEIMDMSQYISNGYTNAVVNELVIQEFDVNHNLIFEWYAHDHLNIGDYSTLNLFLADFTWMHGNSIEIDFDENLILSNRRSSEAIKIDRNTGDVIWILGGPMSDFTFLHDSFNGFSKQHDVRRLQNGNILIFDNGTQHTPQISRIIEYELNIDNMTADLIWEYSHPEEYVGLSMGSVQRLENGNTLINWGNISNSGAIVTEVNMEKEIVMEIHFPMGNNIYKVRKNDWQFNIDLMKADLNLDQIINILDILAVVNIILDSNSSSTAFQLFKSDLNNDGEINIADIIIMITLILE
ncbi:MAG: aryl-sulfate sulfotransferase [Candidatus Marinimicrobia bacterium]|nr:aryl-sulfate sulfotransferase [Candidatus Neomarinimicrobiota bacterium]